MLSSYWVHFTIAAAKATTLCHTSMRGSHPLPDQLPGEHTGPHHRWVYDGQIHHPFRCLVAGPSQSGKSTFVHNLLIHQDDIIDVMFDCVIIVLGTDADKNEILGSLLQQMSSSIVQVIELIKKYQTNNEIKRDFSQDLEKHLEALS